jgi:hypothetical protein
MRDRNTVPFPARDATANHVARLRRGTCRFRVRLVFFPAAGSSPVRISSQAYPLFFTICRVTFQLSLMQMRKM